MAQTYFDQIYDHQPEFSLFGAGYSNTREDAIRILARYVTDPLTPGILKAEQVKYVLLHDDVYRAEKEAPPPVPAGLHLVARLPGDVRALELDQSVQPADLPTVLSENAVNLALVEGLPVPNLNTPNLTTGPNGVRTLRGSTRFVLHWSDPGLSAVQLMVHAQSPSGTQTVELLDASGNTISQQIVGTSDTQIVLGPAGVDDTSTSGTGSSCAQRRLEAR